MATITMTRRITQDDDNHRLRAWVSEASEGLDPKIFAFQRIPSVPFQTWSSDAFVHVCSYTDMVELDPDDPREGLSAFFRKNSFDLVFVSYQELLYTWTRIKRHVRQLLDDIVRINGLEPTSIEVHDL